MKGKYEQTAGHSSGSHKVKCDASHNDLHSDDGEQARINAAHTEVNIGASTFITDSDKAGLAGLTAGQWKQLKDILNKSDIDEKMTSKFKYASWIIDTGASNHMTWSLKEMHEVRDIVACPVGLPDGKNTNATKERIVLLEGGLKLTNVLYAPKLSCNLINCVSCRTAPRG